jgi:hypothetical protein
VSRRAGLVAAALVATSPFHVWYSQAARSYALFALLGAASVLTFGLALRGSRRWLAGWCTVSALTLATHYFGVFLVGAEVVWLLLRLSDRRRVVLASLVPAAVLLAHVPVLLDQRSNGEAVAGSSLAVRIAGIPKNLVVGYSFPLEAAGSAVAACFVLLGLVLVVRLPARERWGALVAGSLAAAVVLVPVTLAALGADYVIARNAIVAVVPAAVCVGGGLASRRLGVVAAVLLCALWTTVAVAPALDASYGRTDWRGAAEAIGLTDAERAVVVTPFMSRSLWRPYLPGLSEPVRDRVAVREVVVVGLATEGGYSASHLEPPAVGEPKPLPGFRVAAVQRLPTFTLVRYVASQPVPVAIQTLGRLALTDDQPGILLQGAPAAAG